MSIKKKRLCGEGTYQTPRKCGEHVEMILLTRSRELHVGYVMMVNSCLISARGNRMAQGSSLLFIFATLRVTLLR